MADLTFTESYDEVYQLETSDPVLGGAGGVANEQAQKLGNRTEWLKARIVPTGTVCQWPISTTPSGGKWLNANGTQYLRASYPTLFEVIGIRFSDAYTIFPGINELIPNAFSGGYYEVQVYPSEAALPATTPQIAEGTSYWTRDFTDSFRLYPTLLDAQNSTNGIVFQPVTGANSLIVERIDRFKLPDYSIVPTIPGGIHIIKS